MFTGIIQNTGTVVWIKATSDFTRYAIQFPKDLLKDLAIGASVSIHGICQTVVAIENETVVFEAIKETLDKTTLHSLAIGQILNIERSLKMGDEIGGHLLSGHVYGTAIISKIDSPPNEQKIFRVQCDPSWMKYIFYKGFIALNGASLTVGNVVPAGFFTVNLIPETLKRTTFGIVEVGEEINVEIDSQTMVIVESVERVLLQSS